MLVLYLRNDEIAHDYEHFVCGQFNIYDKITDHVVSLPNWIHTLCICYLV